MPQPNVVSYQSSIVYSGKTKPGRNKAKSKPPHPTDRIRSNSTATFTCSGDNSEQEGYLASGSSESLSSEEGKTQLKRETCNLEKFQARPRSLSESTDSESLTSREYGREQSNRPPNALAAARVHGVTIYEGLGLKNHNELCSGNENQSSSDGECFQPCQEQNPHANVSTYTIVVI